MEMRTYRINAYPRIRVPTSNRHVIYNPLSDWIQLNVCFTVSDQKRLITWRFDICTPIRGYAFRPILFPESLLHLSSGGAANKGPLGGSDPPWQDSWTEFRFYCACVWLHVLTIKRHSRPQRPRSFWSAPRTGQRSRFLVLTKRTADSGDENGT